MSEKSPDQNLEDFRYDAKLFKQAYKAGLKAKEVEKENKRKKLISILIGIPSFLLIVLLSIWVIRSPLFRKPNYIKRNIVTKTFSNVETIYEPSKVSKTKFDEKFVDAKSALYADLNTGEILYSKNPKEKLYIASLTKLMSALVVLREFNLDENLEVQEDWYDKEDMSWSLGFDKGDTVTVETLLKAMLISSYNDAAYILANHYGDGVEDFIEEMNKYARTLGLENTQFNNPSGLDSNGGNTSTVEDLYRLATIIYKNDFIMNILSKSYTEVSWDIGDEKIYTTNALMGQYGNIAGKTGYTELSGGCFLGITKNGKISIVLGSDDRFAESEKILKYL